MKTLRDHARVSEAFPVPEERRGRRRKRSARKPEREPGDLGRLLLSQSAAWTFLGLTLGVFVSRKFFILPLAVALTVTQELAKHRLENRYGR